MTFTKEIFPYYQSSEFGHFYNCKLYTLFDDENKVGQFLISHEVAFISTKDIKFRIDIKNNIFTSSEYIISDIESKTKIGFYTFLASQIMAKEIGILTLNNEKYICKKVDLKYNLFKKTTWDYKISLANNLTEIILTIKLQTTWLGAKHSEFRAAKGEIKSNKSDASLFLTGLFFFEFLLSNNDESV